VLKNPAETFKQRRKSKKKRKKSPDKIIKKRKIAKFIIPPDKLRSNSFLNQFILFNKF